MRSHSVRRCTGASSNCCKPFALSQVTTRYISRYQREAAKAMSVLDLDSVPNGLCKTLEHYVPSHLDSLPFMHDCPVSTSEPSTGGGEAK